MGRGTRCEEQGAGAKDEGRGMSDEGRGARCEVRGAENEVPEVLSVKNNVPSYHGLANRSNDRVLHFPTRHNQ